MKLLLVTNDYPPSPGGVARYYAQLVAAMGSSAEVYVPKLSSWMWPAWISWIKKVRQIFLQSRSDAIWVGQVLPVGTVALILKFLGGPKYIVSVHGTDILAAHANPWKRWLAQRILSNATAITAPSKFSAKILLQHFNLDQSKVAVIYSGVTSLQAELGSAEAFRQKLGISAAAPIVLGVGRLVERKGFDLLLRSMSKVWAEQPDAHCVIVGDGPELQKLKNLIAGLKKPNQVHNLTDLEDSALAAAYSAAAVFVLPGHQVGSDVEGFGMVCIEASAAGVPVVATDTGGVSEAIEDGRTGFVLPKADPEAVSSAVLKILGDESLRQRMSAAGKQWAAEFNWEKSAAKLMSLVQSVV